VATLREGAGVNEERGEERNGTHGGTVWESPPEHDTTEASTK